MAEINQIPTKTETLTENELQELANLSMAACGIPDVTKPKIRLVNNLEEAKELFTRISYQEIAANTSALRSEETAGHPLGFSRGSIIKTSSALGFEGVFRALGDGTNNRLALRVIGDLLMEAGFSNKQGEYTDNQGRDLFNFGGHFPRYHLGYRLSDALGWELVTSLEISSVSQKANPYKPYVDIMRPTQWPIGYNLDSGEFLVATP